MRLTFVQFALIYTAHYSMHLLLHMYEEEWMAPLKTLGRQMELEAASGEVSLGADCKQFPGEHFLSPHAANPSHFCTPET